MSSILQAGISLVFACAIITPHGRAQCDLSWRQDLVRPGSGIDFGSSSAMHGNRLLVGDPLTVSGGLPIGTATLFRLESDQWVYETEFLPPSPNVFGGFGASIALDEERVIVGTFQNQEVSLFRRVGPGWVEEVVLSAPDLRFGRTVSIAENFCVAYGSESLHVYEFNGATWNLAQTLTSSDPSVATISSDALAMKPGMIIASGDGVSDGVCFVFEFQGGSWVQTQIIDPVVSTSRTFGTSLDLDEDFLAVGATPFGLTGMVQVFREIAGNYEFDALLEASDGRSDHRFGANVAIDGDRIFVGDPGHSSGDGAIYRFRRRGPNDWTEEQILFEDTERRLFGASVAADEMWVAGGAPDTPPFTGPVGVIVFRDGGLILDASASTVSAGDSLTLTTTGGVPDSINLLFLTSIDGVPFVRPLLSDIFLGRGEHVVDFVIPAGLEGFTYGLSMAGTSLCEGVQFSNEEPLVIQ